MKYSSNKVLLTFLLFLVTLPLSLFARTNKGTIEIKVGETYPVEHGYGKGYSVSGYWKRTGGTAFIIADSDQSVCWIEGRKVGTSTLTWTGVVSGGWNTWDEEYYWTIVVTAPASIPVTEIELNKTQMTLEVNKKEQLTATVYPNNATDKSVTWSSSEDGIVSVSSSGEVNAKTVGNATITCKANDGSGISASCSITVLPQDVVVAEINSTNFPDKSFRNYLLKQYYGKDGKLTESEIKNIDLISIGNSDISNLKGIEYFTSLYKLYCSNNQLTTLDVSKNTALTELYCSNNQLTTLDVSKNTALTELDCSGNQLTALDVSKNTTLTNLYCYSNQLTALDVSKNTALSHLSCPINQLTALDVSKNTALTYLECSSNQLTALDVSKNMALSHLSCHINQLTALDVSKNTALTNLQCSNNQLTALDVSKNTALTELSCQDNKLAALDVSKNTALTKLDCYYNQLMALDVSKNTALTYLECSNNQLTALDVSKNTTLTNLYCYSNQLTALDVSKNTALSHLNCSINQLTTLVISKNSALTGLSCNSNQIKGQAMDKLIGSLPNNSSGKQYDFYVFRSGNDEGNVFTKAQAAAVKAKGWTPKCYDGKEWVECVGGHGEDTMDTDPDINIVSVTCSNTNLSSLTQNDKLIISATFKNVGATAKVKTILGILDITNKHILYKHQDEREFPKDKEKTIYYEFPLNDIPTGEYYATVLYYKDWGEEKDKGWYYKNDKSLFRIKILPETAPSTKGDVNGDGEVNVTDIVTLVNIIMGERGRTEAADVNGDGDVNVTDIVTVVNIIMGNNARTRGAYFDEATDSEQLVINGHENGSLSLSLTSNRAYVATQFDLLLDGQQLEDISMNAERSAEHQIIYKKVAQNRYRVIAYSPENHQFCGSNGEVLSIGVKGSGSVIVDDIVFVTADQQEKAFAPLHSGTTGIGTVAAGELMDIYTSDGRLVHKQATSAEGLRKGVYIINGKKYILR